VTSSITWAAKRSKVPLIGGTRLLNEFSKKLNVDWPSKENMATKFREGWPSIRNLTATPGANEPLLGLAPNEIVTRF